MDNGFNEILANGEFSPLQRNAACHQCERRKRGVMAYVPFMALSDEKFLTRLRLGQVPQVYKHTFEQSKAPRDISVRFRRASTPVRGQVTEARRRTIGTPGLLFTETGDLYP